MDKILTGAAVAGAGIAVFCLRSSYERRHFVTELFEINTDKITKDRTFVFLSDLHNNSFGPDNRELVRAVDEVSPDAVLIGGDMMVCKGKRNTGTALRLVLELASRYPVYYGNGNHETRMDEEREIYGSQYDEYIKALNRGGVHYLKNRGECFDGEIMINGLDLKEEYYNKFFIKKMRPGYIERRLGTALEDRFQILLAHSPLYFDAYRSWGADLSLAGHFHGGTIRLPLLGGVMTPQYQFFLPCCAGFFEKDSRYMIVSRGLGTHSINIRINNKPQLVVVKLTNKSTFC